MGVSVQEELIYRVKKNRANEARSALKKIDMAHFERIFEKYLEGDHKN